MPPCVLLILLIRPDGRMVIDKDINRRRPPTALYPLFVHPSSISDRTFKLKKTCVCWANRVLPDRVGGFLCACHPLPVLVGHAPSRGFFILTIQAFLDIDSTIDGYLLIGSFQSISQIIPRELSQFLS